ncbi:hypothetical protein GmHk_05G013993 [Glycine max]|nr:hypothetical protein GmHk_05G013993 [Glycine max]
MASTTSSTKSVGPIVSFSETLVITSKKLSGSKYYLSWSTSVELWLLGQGHHNHLEKEFTEVLAESQEQWKRLDFQLCTLWQSVEQNILGTLRSFKTCSFLEKAQKIYANDIQRLYDAATKLTSYKQTDHDMTSFIAQIQSAVEELNMLLDVKSMEKM